MDKYHDKLIALAAKLQEEQQSRLRALKLDCQANLDNVVTSIKHGNKYDKVDVGHSGKLMVDRATGEIFGIKAYGKIHRGHKYGTLDTIDKWNWGLFYPARRDQSTAIA